MVLSLQFSSIKYGMKCDENGLKSIGHMDEKNEHLFIVVEVFNERPIALSGV